MATHGVHRRQPHSSLRKKRFQPQHLPGLRKLGLENNAHSKLQERQPSLEGRQLFSIPGFSIPVTDLFPPVIPTAEPPAPATSSSSPAISSTPTTTSTEALPTTSSTPTSSTTTTSTTPTSTPPPPTPTPTSTTSTAVTRVVVTEVDDETAVLTSFWTQSTSSTATGAGSTSLSSDTDDKSSNTGPIVGGIVAGVIALAVLVIALVWFIRRRKRGQLENDIQPFNPHDFRRSAFLINDDTQDASGHGANLNRGLTLNQGAGNDGMSTHAGISATPRPPSMIERRLAHTPVNGYDGGFPPYPSSHGHGEHINGRSPMNPQPMPLHYYNSGPGEEEYYGYGVGIGAGSAASGMKNNFAGYGETPQHYSGPPFGSYNPGQVFDPQNQNVLYGPGQVVEPNMQNPFMTPEQGYPAQLQSPFSPPVEHHNSAAQADHAKAVAIGGTAVLAAVGGAPVLTRSLSTKSGRSGKSGLSISIPKTMPVNATVINGSAGTMEDGYEKNAVEYPALKRQGSSSSASTSRSGSVKRSNNVKAPPPALPTRGDTAEPPSGDYVDLSRSSVSPFQAAQYAEISKRLNTDVPKGLPPLPPPTPDSQIALAPQDRRGLSPFTDPNNTENAMGSTEGRRDRHVSGISNAESVNSSFSGAGPNMLDFPIPPPSPLTVPSRYSLTSHTSSAPGHDEFAPPKPSGLSSRVDSMPPQLPEINLASSTKSAGADSSGAHDNDNSKYASFLNPPPGMSVMMSMGLNSAKDSPIYLSGITAGASPLLGRFPVTPSPFATPSADEGQGAVFAKQQDHKGKQREEMAGESKQGNERPMTVYDEADVYGGI